MSPGSFDGSKWQERRRYLQETRHFHPKYETPLAEPFKPFGQKSLPPSQQQKAPPLSPEEERELAELRAKHKNIKRRSPKKSTKQR